MILVKLEGACGGYTSSVEIAHSGHEATITTEAFADENHRINDEGS